MDKELMSVSRYLKAILDAMPVPIFVMDDMARVVDINLASSRILGDNPEITLRRPFGEILHCIHERESVDGCGKTNFCSDCVVFNSVKSALKGNRVARQKTKLLWVEHDMVKVVHMLVTASPFKYENRTHVFLSLEDVTELTELREILPICMVCKKVRDDAGYWHQVDIYLKKNLDMDFTHSVCPKCLEKMSTVSPKQGLTS